VLTNKLIKGIIYFVFHISKLHTERIQNNTQRVVTVFYNAM